MIPPAARGWGDNRHLAAGLAPAAAALSCSLVTRQIGISGNRQRFDAAKHRERSQHARAAACPYRTEVGLMACDPGFDALAQDQPGAWLIESRQHDSSATS